MKLLNQEIQFFINYSLKYGFLLLAFQDDYLCSIGIGKDRLQLEADIKNRFSKFGSIVEVKSIPKEFSSIISYIENPTQIPPVVQFSEIGTDFQKNVWSALRRIPFGTTITYSDLAKNIGNEKACRAVAQACACNPIAVLTPCHRVIRKDGSLSGYYWGESIKRQLLQDEGVLSIQ